MRIEHEHLKDIVSRLFCAEDVPKNSADFVAMTLVDADLRGHFSHGTNQLLGYLEGIAAGRTNPRPDINVVELTATIAKIDADRGLGQLGARAGMEKAIGLARTSGIGVSTVRHSSHYGTGGYWVRMAIEAGMVGFTTSNDTTATVAPHGSTAPALGNLPFSWGIPAGDEVDIVLDMGTGVVADGKVTLAALGGNAAEQHWGLDLEGVPTINPAHIAALLPFGGPKGFGINLVSDVLGGIMADNESSSVMSTTPNSRENQTSHFFMALNISSFTNCSDFRSRVDQQIRTVRAARLAPRTDRILIPGERSEECRKDQLERGINLPAEIRHRLEELIQLRGLKVPWLN